MLRYSMTSIKHRTMFLASKTASQKLSLCICPAFIPATIKAQYESLGGTPGSATAISTHLFSVPNLQI